MNQSSQNISGNAPLPLHPSSSSVVSSLARKVSHSSAMTASSNNNPSAPQKKSKFVTNYCPLQYRKLSGDTGGGGGGGSAQTSSIMYDPQVIKSTDGMMGATNNTDPLTSNNIGVGSHTGTTGSNPEGCDIIVDGADSSVLCSDQAFQPLPFLPQFDGIGDDDAFSVNNFDTTTFEESKDGFVVGTCPAVGASSLASSQKQVLLLSQTAAGVMLTVPKTRAGACCGNATPSTRTASNSAAYICASFGDALSSPYTPPLPPPTTVCSIAQLSPHDDDQSSTTPNEMDPPAPLPCFQLDPFHPAAVDAFGSFTPSKTFNANDRDNDPSSGDILDVGVASPNEGQVRRSSNPLSLHPYPPMSPSQNAMQRPATCLPARPEGDGGAGAMAALVHYPPIPPPKAVIPISTSRMTLCVGLGGVLMHAHNPRKSRAILAPSLNSAPDAQLLVKTPNETINIYYRPHITHFFAAVAKHFDIAIFSAGEQDYVDALLDVMDPSGQVFPKSRRYYRQHCTKVFSRVEDVKAPSPATFLAKDLQILGRPLNEVVLVDDTVNSGLLQPNNLLLLPTWTGDPSDTALLQLAEHLVCSVKKTARKQ